MKSRILLMFSFMAVAILIEFPVFALTQSAQKWLVDAGQYDCIPVENFGLNGVRLWAPEKSIRNLLGEPSSVSHGDGEDDGGMYKITIYHYPGLRVEAIRQNVDRIIATDPTVAMPSGIRLGDSYQEVIKKFGRAPRTLSLDPREIHLVTCTVDGKWIQEDYATLNFNKEGILTAIRYEANRP